MYCVVEKKWDNEHINSVFNHEKCEAQDANYITFLHYAKFRFSTTSNTAI